MKQLIGILLVSILGFVFVVKFNQNTSVELLVKKMKALEQPIENMIKFNYFQMQKEVTIYPYLIKYSDKASELENFLAQETQNFSIPKKPKLTKEFVSQWNKIGEEYYETLGEIDERESKELEASSILYLSQNFYHSNTEYQSLLATILKGKILSFRLSTSSFLLEKGYGTNCFCFDGWYLILEKPLKINQTSTIPIVHTNRCNRNRGFIHKIWINDELIYEILKKPFPFQKIPLTYNGDSKYHVKVAFQKSFLSPVSYQEFDFDFEMETCD